MKLYFFLLRLLSPLARFVFRVTWRGTDILFSMYL